MAGNSNLAKVEKKHVRDKIDSMINFDRFEFLAFFTVVYIQDFSCLPVKKRVIFKMQS